MININIVLVVDSDLILVIFRPFVAMVLVLVDFLEEDTDAILHMYT